MALTRSREQTDLYISREDLGEQGLDDGAIERLADTMNESHAQQASIARHQSAVEGQDAQPLSEAASIMAQTQVKEHDRGNEVE